MSRNFLQDTQGGVQAVRARTVFTLAGESPARGMDALNAPLPRIDDGVVTACNGKILAVESYASFSRRAGSEEKAALRDFGDCALTPGLINCHNHLELSHMAGKPLTGQGFCDWVASLAALDRTQPEPAAMEAAMVDAIADMRASGTAAVGDIASRIPHAVLRAAHAHGLELRLFLEIFGPGSAKAGEYARTAASDPAFSLAGHALYSTPAESLIRAKEWCAANGRPFSMHLAEHDDEAECLLTGRGKFYDILYGRILPETWRAPGKRPVQYAASLGLLSPGTLAVHCVLCDEDDIKILASSGAGVCLCPRSNALINVGEAPARIFAEHGALLVLGTDSLASNTDLNLWNEAEYFLRKNILPANALLRMATVNGAAQLGYSRHFGRLERGAHFCYTVFAGETRALFH